MAYEPKDMTFSLFPNKDKKTDKHPNLTGTALIDGVAYFIDGWTNTDRNGNKYIAGKLKPKEQQRQQHQSGQSYGKGGNPPPRELDDEIPF